MEYRGKVDISRGSIGLCRVQGHSIWMALGLLIIMTTVLTTATNPTPTVLWRRSEYQITVGHHVVEIEFDLLNPCNGIFNPENVHHDLLAESRSLCQKLYQESIIDELSSMCKPSRRDQVSKTRIKRFIPIILGVISVAVVASIGVGALVTVHSGTIEQFETQIKENRKIILQLTESFNETLRQSSKLQGDYDEFKGKMIGTMYGISFIINEFTEGRNVIQRAHRQWKLGKVSSTFLDYFNITLPCGDRCPIRLAEAQRCSMSQDKTKLFLQFTAPEVSADLTLVEADPFDLMVRKNNQTCVVKYTGPKNLILSESSECIYAVNVRYPASKHDLILAPSMGCKEKNEVDNDNRYFVVDRCERTRRSDEKEFIQIKPHHGHYYIYCPESNFTIVGTQRKCPNNVMKVALTSNFFINSVQFTGSGMSLVNHEVLDPGFTFKANWHLEPTINWTSLMTDVKDDIKEPHMDDFTYVQNWFIGGASTVLMIVVAVVIWLVKKIRKPRVILLPESTFPTRINVPTVEKV